MQVHFWHQHVRKTMLTLEEGKLLHLWCPLCNIMVPWRSLNGLHKHTLQCKKEEEHKRWRLSAEE